jgi:hypothetical protein
MVGRRGERKVLKKVQVEWKVEKVWWRGRAFANGPSATLGWSEERGSEDAKSC